MLPRLRFFTLLELLITVAILAILAGGLVLALDDTESKMEEDMAKVEAESIRKALIQFKKDLGHYPNAATAPLSAAEINLPAGKNNAWLADISNFYLLFNKPVDQTTPERWTWKPGSKSGWNGPYLNIGRASLDAQGRNQINCPSGGVFTFDPATGLLSWKNTNLDLIP